MLGRARRWFRRRRTGTLVVKDLLERAEALALAEGVERPAGEHLLLAACDHPDGTAAAALAAVGTSRDGLADAVQRAHQDALDAVGIKVTAPDEPGSVQDPPAPSGVFRSQPSLESLLRATYDVVQAADGDLVSAWVLVAATEVTHGTVARTLDRLGVDRTDLRRAARQAAIAGGSAA